MKFAALWLNIHSHDRSRRRYYFVGTREPEVSDMSARNYNREPTGFILMEFVERCRSYVSALHN